MLHLLHASGAATYCGAPVDPQTAADSLATVSCQRCRAKIRRNVRHNWPTSYRPVSRMTAAR